ncbi:MAG TPA: HEAT repeat domain-containing protein [Candidatus Angelobacter sp.]|nr:HEAT repeat domain-containing protein [Candidatus Angelobacter sp.]
MNCDWTKENVVLFIYGELADDAKFEFEQHVRHCLGCRRELDAAIEFKDAMAAVPVKEISPSFLAANRMQLQEALEHAEQSRNIFSSFVFDATGWFHQIKLAPALTAALLIIGFAGGVATTYKMTHAEKGPIVDNSVSNSGSSIQPVEANLGPIESITPVANSNLVQIKYNTLQPQTLNGTTDDPRVRQLLLLAARNNRNSSLVLDSLDALTRGTEDNAVREALMERLRYDQNPGVRLKSLDALKGYVKGDVQVRDAVVEALLHDNNAGVRQEAISLLDAVKADTSVRSALTVLAAREPNKFIREESKRYLASMPHLD